MPTDLTTTNRLLGIMAAVSLLEALAVIALIAGGLALYRRMNQAIAGIETRQVAPVAERVNGILDDVRTVTSTVREETERVSRLARWVLNLMDGSGGRAQR